MAVTETRSTEDVHGPIDYLMLEFKDPAYDGAVADALMNLVKAGIVQVYDLLVIRKDDDGTVAIVDVGGLTAGSIARFAVFAGARSGLVRGSDLDLAAEVVAPGTMAAVIVYENTWAIPFVTAALDSGAEVVASARIPAPLVIEALTELEAEDPAEPVIIPS